MATARRRVRSEAESSRQLTGIARLARAASAGLEKLESRRFFAIPAFPGAEGAGGYATGGRGGDVYHVTNLNGSGAGSFAEGLATAPAVGRTIVFDVSGYIASPEQIKLTKSKITIAGQTAPGDGIGLRNGTFWISGDDLVVRHFRFYGHRGGDALDYDSGSVNSILDHVTVAFGPDENFSTWSPPENMTFQDSINAWGLVSHSAGGLWNTNHATALRTLWIHNHTRNPKARPEGVLDWVNNVTADWDIGFIMGDSSTPANWKANVRGSYFVSSYAKTTALEKALLDRNGNPNFSLYMDGSALDGNANGVLDVSRTNYQMASGNYIQAPAPFVNNGVPVTIDDYLTAYKKVVSTSGPLRTDATSAALRDELNAIAISDLILQKKHQVSNVSQTGASNGGWGTLASAPAPVDTDQDGMPDFWENSLGLSAGVQDHNGVLASTGGIVNAGTFMPPNTPAGYTNLEEYLHFLASPHATVAKNTSAEPSSIDIDLAKYTSGFSKSPVFLLSNVTGGTATLLGDGHTVRFVPTANTFGRAKFNFKVTDGDGSTWTQQFNLLVSNQGLPKNLLWKGGQSSNAWDVATENWLKNGVGAGVTFSPGDGVLFDDSGSNVPNINVIGTQSVSGMTVNASKNYTFGGTGSIAGAGGLQKSGTGTLTLNSANTYAGGTIVNGGALVLNTAAAAGSGVIKLNGAGLTMVGGTYVNGLTFAGINSVNITANAQLGALAGGGTFNLNTGSTVTLAGDTSGFAGALNLTNNGFLRFNGGLGSANAAFDLGVGTGNLLSRNGNVTIALGALRGGANTRVTGASSAGNLTTYSIGGAGLSTTFAGGITDGGFADSTADITAVTKTGAGALVLTGTANAYTGATAVNAGLLEVNGSLGNTAVTVASGAALTGGGIIGSATGGAVTLQTGAKLAPGAGGGTGPGNLRVGNGLTLATGSNLSFDLTSSPAGNNDKITLNGGVLTMNGTINVSFNLVDGYLAPGTYTLITGGANTSAAGATFAFNLPAGARQTYNLVRPVSGNGECYVQLVVSGNPSANLLWRPGAGSTAWDLNATPNWKNGAATETFFNLDGVTFDNDAAGVVDLAGSVKPREVVVNNPSAAYTFGGAGTLDGSGSLTKTGAGVLTLNGTGVNTYAGGTFLNGGTLQLGNDIANASALGTGPITLANGTTLKMFDSAAGGAQIANWNLVVPTGSNATVWQDSRSQITGTLSGGGTLNLRESWVRNDLIADASNFTGQINVITDNDGGEFRFGTNYAYAGFPNAAVNLADKVAAFYIGTVSEEADGTVIDIGELTGAVGSTLRGGLTGGRTVTYRIGGRNTNAAFAGTIAEQNLDSITSLVKTGTGTWTLTGNASYKGTTVVEAGTLRVAGSLASAGGSFVVKSGATLDLAGGTLTADSIEVEPGGMILGTGAIVGDLVNNGTVTLGGGDGTFLSVSGEVQNLGTMTIDGRAISMGALTVVAGSTTKLATRGNIVLDVGTLNLEPGASLDLRNNALIVRSGNVGTWTGSTFDGVTGQVRDGRNGGAWNGNGIVTTVAPNQPADLTTLAVAPASHVLGLSGADTGTWNGRTVDASAILVKYTYTGDADLNGKINGDDYFIIDSKIAQSSALRGWRFGDFNYDGKINGDDYFSLDSNIARQGVVL